MYVYFKVSEGNIKVEAIVYRNRIKLGQGYLDHTADVVWYVTPERIEWLKDRWQDQFTDRDRNYAFAFIECMTSNMSSFARALAESHGLNLEDLEDLPSGTTRVPYSEDSHGQG